MRLKIMNLLLSKKSYMANLGLILFFVISLNANAHHSHANLNANDIQTHRGIVEKYGWGMPHVYIKVKAPSQSGEIVLYNIELLNPPGMLQRGWDKDSLKVGDQIIWEGSTDHNPKRYYSGLDWLEKADGTRLAMNAQVMEATASSDFSGLWMRDLRGGRPFYNPPEGWPYSELGKQMVANFNENENPQVSCINPGIPKATLLPYPMQITRPNADTFVFNYELREYQRTIVLNQPKSQEEPSVLGSSVARMEGDKLIIETDNFIADRWGIHTGVDSSMQKHLVEEISLSEDGKSLSLMMVVTDPVYLTEPVIINYHMRKIPDRELIQAPCTLESSRFFLDAGL
ncbi:MAG: hypothetical protein ACI934_000186 [Pseudohongiellaceae bacterium]|jgi:hypothetical protein